MGTPLDDLDAFFQEHQRCGELDTGVENGRLWLTCDGCGAILDRFLGRIAQLEEFDFGRD
jgi:hypothetical protein